MNARGGKVNGTRVLDRVLAGMRLDFCVVLFSDQCVGWRRPSGLLRGQCVSRRLRLQQAGAGGTHVAVIAWDGWQTVGMAAAAEQEIAALTAHAGVRAQGRTS